MEREAKGQGPLEGIAVVQMGGNGGLSQGRGCAGGEGLSLSFWLAFTHS